MRTSLLTSSVRNPRTYITLVAILVFAAGVHWGTFVVGGSDSYCYVHQAEGWAAGHLQQVEPLALDAPWPAAPLTFAPAGHIPSPTVRGAAVPICPAGLSIVMAPFLRAGSALGRPDAVFIVVPLFGALLIGATNALGSRFSACAGVSSALLVTCSPAFLFQLMQPMSDVPAAALWILAAVCASSRHRRAPLGAGLATSGAILIRPNLLPMGLVLGLHFLLPDSEYSDGPEQESEYGDRLRPESEYAAPSGRTPTPGVRGARTPTPRGIARAVTFALASAPGCIAVAIIQQLFYGSPFSSGYGSLAGLFALDHVAPNALRYVTWMWQSHTPVWLIALAAPIVLPRRLTTLLLALSIANVLCYLPYVVFNDWWYLRFLLPAIALVLVLTAATIDAMLRGVKRRGLLVAAVTAVICVLLIGEARGRQVFGLRQVERRYERAGLYVASHLPANAIVITSWESGSVRFYGHRKTVVWDVLDPMWLDRVIVYSRSRGLQPYLLFEAWEEPLFRQRFAGSVVARLDWPPVAEIAGQVRIYRPDDRQRYLHGNAAPTDYAR